MERSAHQTFESFIVGESNRFAFAAAKAAAEQPGRRYDPLWIYGGSGLGKTHLLHGVWNEVLRRTPDAFAEFFQAEELTDALLRALQAKEAEAFFDKLRRIELLLIDDLQVLAGKSQTQAEFLRMLHVLVDGGGQVVMASSVEPKVLGPLADGIRARFAGGLAADIRLPDAGECLEIARRKAALSGLALSGETVEAIAAGSGGDVRRIEGAITRLQAEKELLREQPGDRRGPADR